MNNLIDLSIHGSIVLLLVCGLEILSWPRMAVAGRRWWWIAIPVVFLVVIPVPVLPILSVSPGVENGSAWLPNVVPTITAARVIPEMRKGEVGLISGVWLVGELGYLFISIAQTRAAMRRWAAERLSTDSVLLDLLEDCKNDAGITAPIGLVITEHIAAPAILGWLRPRILLPAGLVTSLSKAELRAVLFHELAHFRSMDIPVNWLFTLACSVHWFNPMAHLAFRGWSRFREEAADEAAIGWVKEPFTYGEALLKTLQQTEGGTPPFGALAIGETINNLKKRITMINNYQNLTARSPVAGILLLLVLACLIIRPTRAEDSSDPQVAAVPVVERWLTSIDENHYAESWKEASKFFQSAITSEKWVETLNAVRTPLGKCNDRKLVSALHQSKLPDSTGEMAGDYVVVQFDTSFTNLAYAVETATFVKAPDGSWKAAGYYIKPKP